MEELSKQATKKRVFINNVDSYTSKHIAKHLCGHAPAADKEENDNFDGETMSQSKAFTVIGTISDQAANDTPFVLERYFRPDKGDLLSKLMECDVIIYDVSQHVCQVEEALWAVSALHSEIGQFSSPKTFVLVSTVMTWACSKPLDPDDDELPFTDEHYWMRRAHPNFKRHTELEKRVVKLGQSNTTMFSTYVVTSGLQYGMGEHIFHYFFKTAWMGKEEELPVFGDGRNVVPMIHVCDLSRVIQNVVEHQPGPRYLLAVDSSNNTMEDVLKAVASELGPGKVGHRPMEEAFLTRDLSVMDVDSLMVNLVMDAVHINTLFSMDWECGSGLVQNMELVVEQYRQVRALQPIRLCVLGPPAVGKSCVCKRLCDHYKLQYISLSDFKVSCSSEEEMEADSDAEEENTEEGTMTEQLRALKDKLMSTQCRNQGFVLDDFPLTYEQAKEFFCEFVVCLDASDTFLTDRVINLPEEKVLIHNYEPKHFLKRLSTYRASNMADNPVVDFFTELDIKPLIHEMSSISDDQSLMQKIFETIGPPRNYGPATPELEEEERRKTEEKMRREAALRAEEEQWEAEEAKARAARWEEWSQGLAELKQQEEQLLEAQSLPMRKYLMEHVMPTLTSGLVECCRVNPQDTVDYLAQYLLQNNPTSSMHDV
ncbi:adenylate kinase 7 isoform X2 [Gouania willdenowi]|uniref:adenylate kinase 7 isoform X2 n=1 Tax=Gouania willdenowi TaxID=441366 RepID=UPI0010565325|nr:adenylate kinase 7 isoform X2 [Gouania willdenowi]